MFISISNLIRTGESDELVHVRTTCGVIDPPNCGMEQSLNIHKDTSIIIT